MAVHLNGGEFPITFDVENQNVHKVFGNKDDIIHFLDSEVGFWTEVIRSSKSAVSAEVEHVIAESCGRMAINAAYNRVRASDDPQELANVLSELSMSAPVFGDGADGRIIRQAIQEGTAQPLGMVLSAAAGHPEIFRPSLFENRRALLSDLAISVGGAVQLAVLRSHPKAKKSEIDRIIASARIQLKDAEAQQREVTGWFEAHRTQLDTEISTAREKLNILKSEYESGFSEAIKRSGSLVAIESNNALERVRVVGLEAKEQLETLHDETQARLQALENIYASKLVLKGPSQLWRSVRNRAALSVAISLFAFIGLLAAPAWLIGANWTQTTLFLKELVTASSTGISLTAIAALTIPTIGYGWLLRHVSRIFVHNLNLVSDAEYREVLATTFLGLAEQKSAGVTEAERALVLNALFRPAPPNMPDDGPPSGILDLIKKA